MTQRSEFLYRRCSRKEADKISSIKGLPFGKYEIMIHGLQHNSDPSKWISKSRNAVLNYSPKGVNPDEYRYCVVLRTAIGTTNALEIERMERSVKRGTRGAYGIPGSLIGWFNKRVLGVEVYDLDSERIPHHESGFSTHFLFTAEGKISTFMAFSPKFLSVDLKRGIYFNDNLNFMRMSWVKTSLLWTLWRSDWGMREGQECVIKIDVPEDYMRRLMGIATPTKSTIYSEVLYQRDPDRRIVGRRWKEGKEYFVKGGNTVHFGIRNSRLEEYFTGISVGNVSDITETMRKICEARPMHPTAELYSTLGLEPMIPDYLSAWSRRGQNIPMEFILGV